MKYWRFAAVLFLSLFCLLLAAGCFIFRNRKDLSFLFVKENSGINAPRKKKIDAGVVSRIPDKASEIPTLIPRKKEVSIENIRILPYEGRQMGFLPVINAVSGLESSLSTSIRILSAKSAVLPSKEDRLDFVPVDSAKLSVDAPYEVVLDGGGSSVKILIPIEALTLRFYPADELIASALVEALLAKQSRAFADSPDFLRHGLALYISGFGDYYEKRFLIRADREPAQMALPLSDSSSSAWADGFWALKALRDKRGDDGVATLLNEIVDGKEYKGALEKAFGADFNAFQDHYKAFSLNYLSVIMTNRPLFKKAVLLLRELKEEECYPILLDFTKNHPTDLYAGEASYYLSYADYRLGNSQKAIDGFLDLLNNRPYSMVSQGKAHYFLGRCYDLKRFRSLAVIEYRLGNLEDSDLLKKASDMRLKELEK
jgi:hypothetical protein